MKIVAADPSRMIDLPGAGPCPRPTDIDESVTGFSRLKSLRIYRFAPGVEIEGESEGDEVLVIPLDGAVRVAIAGAQDLTATVGPGSPARAIYMPPRHGYRLTPESETHVAYARAEVSGVVPVQTVGADHGDGPAEALRFRIETLADGDTIGLGGDHETLAYAMAGGLTADATALVASSTLLLNRNETACMAAEGPAGLLIVTA